MSVKLSVKHGGQDVALELPEEPAPTVSDVKRAIETATGVFVRNQKLIHKGKTLADGAATLGALKIASGAKLMLLASEFVNKVAI